MNGGQMFGAPMYGQTYPQVRIHGKVVTSLSEVGAFDVPMDGTMGWFPSADGTKVWGRRWSPNGSIETVLFTPEAIEEPDEGGVAELSKRVAALEEAIASIGKEDMVEPD